MIMATIKSHQKITPFLSFDRNAEEAVKFYVSVFSAGPGGKNSKIGKVSYYGEGTSIPAGTVMTVMFKIEGQQFFALNGGPNFKFTEAISFMVNCKTQNEIDYYWEKLSKGGTKVQCGWLKDKFGVSWQVVPTIISEIITDKNAEKNTRVMQAIMKMKKLNIKTLEQAYNGKNKS
jgi:predicted 3-demethylubiquinone-9 3-methyltransferase (glyoxalase superfamily)